MESFILSCCLIAGFFVNLRNSWIVSWWSLVANQTKSRIIITIVVHISNCAIICLDPPSRTSLGSWVLWHLLFSISWRQFNAIHGSLARACAALMLRHLGITFPCVTLLGLWIATCEVSCMSKMVSQSCGPQSGLGREGEAQNGTGVSKSNHVQLSHAQNAYLHAHTRLCDVPYAFLSSAEIWILTFSHSANAQACEFAPVHCRCNLQQLT